MLPDLDLGVPPLDAAFDEAEFAADDDLSFSGVADPRRLLN